MANVSSMIEDTTGKPSRDQGSASLWKGHQLKDNKQRGDRKQWILFKQAYDKRREKLDWIIDS